MQVCASRGLPNKQDNPTNIVQTSRAKFDDIWQMQIHSEHNQNS